MARFNAPPSWQHHLPEHFVPPTDWQPEPSWGPPPAGWALWVDESTGQATQPPYQYAQNPFLNVSTIPQHTGSIPGGTPASATEKKPLSKKAKIGIGVGAVVIFAAMVGACGGGDETSTSAVATPSASEAALPAAAEETASAEASATPEPVVSDSPEPEPEPEPEVKMPAVQQKFSETVADASAKYDETDNELKATKVIMDRDKSLCTATGGSFKGWKATVDDVGSTGDGYGYIAVIMEDDIELSTWNNALSDTFDNTLIKPSNKLYDVLMELSAGDEVTIAGDFAKGENTCVQTSNLTEVLNASSPDFKVNFSSIKVD